MPRSGLEVQKAAIKALFLREMKTRFGKFRLGYLWAPLEPVAHMLVMLAIFGYLMQRTMPDISFPVFLINGIIPFLLFSSITNRSINAIEANQGLFNYRPVRPIDTIIARTILEAFISGIVYFFLMSLLWLFGEEIAINNFIQLVCVWGLLIVFSTGIGLIFMVIGNRYPESEKFLPIVLKPLYFVSCIMFSLHHIPADYQPYLLWNPIVHIVELSRESVVNSYHVENVSLGYLAFSSLVVFFFGLSLYRTQEEAMLTS